LRGGVTGAAIGGLIGDEITMAAGAIGGALGEALAGPVGGVIGSITASLASKLPGFDKFVSDIFGIADKDTATGVKNLGIDIKAFGGLQGFFERIGGFQGIRGERMDTLRSSHGRRALVNAIRVSSGATQEQAQDVVTALIAGGHEASGAPQLGVAPGQIALPGVSSSMDQLRNVLRTLGFDEESIARLAISDRTLGERRMPGEGDLPPLTTKPGDDFVKNPFGPLGGDGGTPAEGEPPPGSGKAAPGALGTVSISRARSALRDGRRAFDDYLKRQGVGPHSPVYNNLLNLLTSTNPGIEATARDWLLNSSGYDIVAGTGFVGRINRPTSILVGEHGTPENISIQPVGSGDGFMGGGRGPGGTVNHFNFTVNSLDPRGMRDALQGELGDQIKQMIRESSERGEEVVYSGGVVSPPSV